MMSVNPTGPITGVHGAALQAVSLNIEHQSVESLQRQKYPHTKGFVISITVHPVISHKLSF